MSSSNRKLRIVGYIRVSTVEQARHGESLTTQRARIERYLELTGAELVDIIADDGKSGKSLDREGFQEVLRRLRNDEVDGICVSRLDRMTRRVPTKKGNDKSIHTSVRRILTRPAGWRDAG